MTTWSIVHGSAVIVERCPDHYDINTVEHSIQLTIEVMVQYENMNLYLKNVHIDEVGKKNKKMLETCA
jgi:hypothetical protein